jgi:hypothetical protein
MLRPLSSVCAHALFSQTRNSSEHKNEKLPLQSYIAVKEVHEEGSFERGKAARESFSHSLFSLTKPFLCFQG